MKATTTGPWISHALAVVAALLVLYTFVQQERAGVWHGPWIVVATVVSSAAFLVVNFLRRPAAEREAQQYGDSEAAQRAMGLGTWLRPAVGLVGVVFGALGSAPTQSLLVLPVAFILIQLTIDDRFSPWIAVGLAAVALALTPIGCLIDGSRPGTVLALEASVLVWLLIGYARRQARLAEVQSRRLAEQALAAREERAKAEVLADRQAAARDIHDVLAHSLGGLVLQLDAVDALLESGRVAEAARRVSDARQLAADGLRDAREAVATLRSPEEPADRDAPLLDLADAAEHLVAVHRSLGGTIDFEASGDLTALPAPLAAAFERTLQEALSNARKHAPGAPVMARLVRTADAVELTVRNPAAAGVASSLAGTGGGHGLTGMAERFAALEGGRVEAGEREGRFLVAASAELS